MSKHNQNGSASSLVVSLILCVILLIATFSFAIWAYSSRQQYKNDVDAKINVAVQAAQTAQQSKDQANFALEEQQPLATYNSPSQYGSLVVKYPKDWSAYVDDTGNGQALVDGYFNPSHVPSISAQGSTFALRVQVLNQSYTSTLQNYSGSEQDGTVTATAYALPNVKQVVGVELSGQLQGAGHPNDTMVILPLRSYTLEIWTMGAAYLNDFNNSILSNFSFSP